MKPIRVILLCLFLALVAGAAAWVATAKLVDAEQWHGEVLYADAPYGVFYVVATWLA